MANPRQRRKARSSTYKPNTLSRRSRKVQQNKAPTVRGPQVLQDAWDRTKTVRQNYAALGLLHDLNPASSGGTEIDVYQLAARSSAASTSAAQEAPEPSHVQSVLRKGFGRIIRDEAGNVIDVEMAEEDEEEHAGPAEDEIEDLDAEAEWKGLGAESDWVKAISHSENDADGGVVSELERLAASGVQLERFTSTGEKGYLDRLVAKYGSDVEAMARDRRLNPEQKTVGELNRAIRKAGGLGRLGMVAA